MMSLRQIAIDLAVGLLGVSVEMSELTVERVADRPCSSRGPSASAQNRQTGYTDYMGDWRCWGLVLKCYELRTRQHKMLNINALRPPEHYFHKDLMNFGRRSRA
jgi:hypothetical protein